MRLIYWKYQFFLIATISTLAVVSSCNPKRYKNPLFTLLPKNQTGFDFKNQPKFNKNFNIYTYPKFYDGGGVAVGDVNGDNLPDIYMIQNMGPNRLFLNRSNFRFEDVTDAAGVAGSKPWSTGASMADVNGDGYIDIYVSNSGELGDRRNELFINNGNSSGGDQVPTFTESAKQYGLDDPGYSSQAIFFDYDGDNFLDMYLLNNSNEPVSDYDLSQNLREKKDISGGDRLYHNNDGFFTDVTKEAGLFSSDIGFGLSASVADLNRDGWPDIYVANDFFERDYLYLNNKDGSFREVLPQKLGSMSLSSMGSDIADINNDGWPDIYVTDMLGMNEMRRQKSTIIDDWDYYHQKDKWGYGHQLTRNTLQLNNGNASFIEIGRLLGVEATDWSWSTLLADWDHNGFTDIAVTNGIFKEINNLDYLSELSDRRSMRTYRIQGALDIEQMVEMIPSFAVPNFMFSNKGQLQFVDKSEEWGFKNPGFSSGVAWADLDGDGDLDIVINNTNNSAWIYCNHAVELYPNRTWLKIDLKGESPNTLAIGAQLQVWAEDKYWYREHNLQKGFLSSVQPGLHVGLGEGIDKVDSLVVRWPDGRTSWATNLLVPVQLELNQKNAENRKAPPPPVANFVGDLH